MEKINKKIREKRKIIFILRINLRRRTNLYFRMLMLGSIENASETLTQTFPILRGEERERGRRTAKTSSLFTSKLKNLLSSAAVRRETSTRSLTKSKRIRTQDFLPLTLPQVFLISMTGPNSFKMMKKRKYSIFTIQATNLNVLYIFNIKIILLVYQIFNKCSV